MMRYSQLHSEPDFRGAEELENLIPRLETARFEPVYVMGKVLENRLAVVSNKTEQVYCLPTERYHINTNAEVIVPFARVLVESGLDFSGSIREIGGKMTASFVVEHPDYRPTVKGEGFGMVITIRNSYDSELAMSGILDFLRLACTNGMVGLFPEMSWYATHVMSMDEAVTEWGSFLDRILDAPSMLAPLVEQAKSKECKTQDAYKVLLGAGFGSLYAGRIFDQLNGIKATVDGWELYNAGTATFSHAENGQLKLDTQRENLAKCNRLITGDWSKYLADGEKAIQATEDAKKERQAKRNLA
jgi:hypothetical protein